MRAVVQRVDSASVEVENIIVGEIKQGLLVLLGVKEGDGEKEADYLINKIPNLRIFSDENDKMNLSLIDINASMLVVSQFTLCGDVKKGRRPSFVNAAKPDCADNLYNYFVNRLKEKGIHTQTGQFQAMMNVSLVNSGPVTFIIDTDD